MNPRSARIRDLVLVAAGLAIALGVIALSVATSVEHQVTDAAARVGAERAANVQPSSAERPPDGR